MKKLTRYRLKEALELLSGSILPMLFWLTLIFGFDAPYVAILTVICAVIHEVGHYIAILMLSSKASRLRGHISGFRIKLNTKLTYKNEILILIAGPASNIAIFLILIPFSCNIGEYLRLFSFLNLVTGISNLLPVEGYDGYEALYSLFQAIGNEGLIRRLNEFSFLFSSCATFFSLYLIDRFGEGYWIFGLFFVTTLSKLVFFGKYDIFRE